MNKKSSDLEFVHDDNYFTVQGWMRSRLGLKGTQRDVYAIIYGFSQNNGESWFHGTIRYLSEWVGVNRQSIMTALAALVEKGLIEKRKMLVNGVWVCDYRAVQKLDGGVQKLDTYNIRDTINLTNTNVLVKGDSVACDSINDSNSQKTCNAGPATKPSYGNSTINSMFDFWQEQVGTPIISREKSNRRACYNLLRNKRVGEEKLRRAVEFVGEIKEDRFAPRISDFVDLQSKFNELCAFKVKRDAQQVQIDDKTPNKAVSRAMKGNSSAGGNVEFVPWRPTAGDLERELEWNEKERRQTEESAKVDPEWLKKLKIETIRKVNSKGGRNDGD